MLVGAGKGGSSQCWVYDGAGAECALCCVEMTLVLCIDINFDCQHQGGTVISFERVDIDGGPAIVPIVHSPHTVVIHPADTDFLITAIQLFNFDIGTFGMPVL